MKRLRFLKILAGAVSLPLLSISKPKKQIVFEDLLENYCPNDNLFVMKPGKHLDLVLSMLNPMVSESPVYLGIHGYDFPATVNSEEELEFQLKLIAHEMNKHLISDGHSRRSPFYFYKNPDGSFRLNMYTVNSWNVNSVKKKYGLV